MLSGCICFLSGFMCLSGYVCFFIRIHVPLIKDKKLQGHWLGLSFWLVYWLLAPPQARFPVFFLLILSENQSIVCLEPALGSGFGQDWQAKNEQGLTLFPFLLATGSQLSFLFGWHSPCPSVELCHKASETRAVTQHVPGWSWETNQPSLQFQSALSSLI